MTVQPFISRKRDNKEFWTEERCFIVENHNTPLDETLSVAQARVEPGVTTAWHRLRNTSERYTVIEGRGLVEVGEDPAVEVAPGDVVFIPAGVRQRITNNGADQLVFLALCTPRFRSENYEPLE